MEVKIEGIVELISSAGKLQIRNGEGELFKIRFSKKMYQAVKPLRMGDTVSLLANEKMVFNSTTQEEKKSYSLISIDTQSTPSGTSPLPAEESHNE